MNLLFCGGLLLSLSEAIMRPVAVVSYLPEWRYEGANWDTIAQYSSHLILFSLEMSPTGEILAKDRIPRPELLQQAREATRKHGCRLLICFGGNGRSAGFSPMVRSRKARERFLTELVELIDIYELDGVDYNWEYPGYSFGRGYLAEEEINLDYDGLASLVKETYELFQSQSANESTKTENSDKDHRVGIDEQKAISLAYYPDIRQERSFATRGVDEYVDLMHMMTYDQPGEDHSSIQFAQKAINQAIQESLDLSKLTLGLPFYGRHERTGQWMTYEDIVQKHHPLDPDTDRVRILDSPNQHQELFQSFNGIVTIREKTKMAISHNLGGVMIWEVGQDCRIFPVTHGDQTHVSTCPKGEDSSLLAAIAKEIQFQNLITHHDEL